MDQREARLVFLQALQPHQGGAARRGIAGGGRFRQRLLALRRLSERDLDLAVVQQRIGIVGLGLEQRLELRVGDRVAGLVLIVQGLRELLIRGPHLGIEFLVPLEVRDARRHAGMIFEILVDETVVLGVGGAQMLHERHHRVGIVAGPRHQEDAVLVGLQLVGARHLRDHALFGELAEPVDERREDRRDPDEQVQRLHLRGQRHRVAAFVVARLVTDDAGEFVVGLREVEQPFVDVNVAAERRERVDVGLVEDLDVVGNVAPRDLRPQLVADLVDPLVQQRVGDDRV